VADHSAGSYLWILYEGPLEQGGRWINPRWELDEFDEHLMYESYGDT
jgi:hypothetical protein